MPTFELIFLLKKMDPSGLKSVLTRNAKYVLESGAILKKMENFGFQKTPFRVSKTGVGKFDSAHYFLFHYNAGHNQNLEILDKFKRDLDVIRSTSFMEKLVPGDSLKTKPKLECTLHQDLLPPSYRPSVISMLKIAEQKRRKKNAKHKFNYSTGLDYDPL